MNMPARLKRIAEWFAYTPADLPPGEARMHTGTKIGYCVWLVVQTLITLVFLTLDQPVLTACYAISTVLTVGYFTLYLNRWPKTAFVAANAQNIVTLVVTTLYTGLGTGFFLFALVGLIFATLAEWVSRWVQHLISAVNAAVFVGLLIYGLYVPPQAPLPLIWVVLFAAINGATTAGFLLMVALTYRATVDRAEAALETEYAKSEALLHNIMPPRGC